MHRERKPKVVLEGRGIGYWHDMAWWHHGRSCFFWDSHIFWGIFSNPQFWGVFSAFLFRDPIFFGVFSQWKFDSFLKRVLTEQNFQRLKLVWSFFGGWKWSTVPRWNSQMYQQNGKDGKISLSIHFLRCEWAIFRMGCFFLPPRTSTATNKHPTNIHFGAKKPGCRGVEALPKDLDEVGFFRQQTDKKGDIFSHGWRADWLIFMFTHGSPNGKPA